VAIGKISTDTTHRAVPEHLVVLCCEDGRQLDAVRHRQFRGDPAVRRDGQPGHLRRRRPTDAVDPTALRQSVHAASHTIDREFTTWTFKIQ